MRRALLVLAALAAAWLLACVFLFVRPPEDAPERADAVVVLAGDPDRRIPRGLELLEDGVAERLVLSRDTGPRWERWRELCGDGGVVCFRADPYSTSGEADAVARLAAERGWRSLVVVTSRYHLVRSRLLFERCHSGPVDAVAADYDRRWVPVILPLETAKLAHALVVERSC